MKKIYFLCTGNSCRSQMAEGFGHHFLPAAEYEVRSAGIEAHGVNPKAIMVMAEVGISIESQTSKVIDPVYFTQADLIITLCGDARDRCPRIPVGTTHLHWDLPDPAQATGSESEILAQFRAVRDEIQKRVQTLL